MGGLTKGQREALKVTFKEYIETPEKQMKPKIKKLKYSCECQSFEVYPDKVGQTAILHNNYLCVNCGYNMFCETVYESIPESLEDKLNDWLDKNNGKFPSAEAWRKALVKEFLAMSYDHNKLWKDNYIIRLRILTRAICKDYSPVQMRKILQLIEGKTTEEIMKNVKEELWQV